MQRAIRSRLRRPFVELVHVDLSDPRYEDAVFGAHVTFTSAPNIDVHTSMLLYAGMSKHSETFRSTFLCHPLSTPPSNMDEVRARMSDSLSAVENGDINLNKTELWIIHRESQTEHVVKLTANLPHTLPTANYPYAQYQGSIHVEVNGENLVVPVYLWREDSIEELIFLFDNVEKRAVRKLVPTEYQPTMRAPVSFGDDTSYEKGVVTEFTSFLSRCKYAFSDDAFDPNGYSTFPDWRANIEAIGKSDVEITRLMHDLYEPNLIRIGREPLRSIDDPRVVNATHNKRLDKQAARQAITAALQDKGAKKSQVKSGNKYILIIVNEIFLDLRPWFSIWEGQDYSAFEAVFLAHRNHNTGEYRFDLIHPSRLEIQYLN